ncbi:efflux RND transporter periplasmic adaptor subunit [Empedobacter falsenii]|uniref:efflux RND transporter periplasmic adaptor subunit n=1 Tax=Empedobacter sp. GD03797 TaxID=2975382 RepID=UPI00244BE62D|nr:efflux RND transporter periplasmic adaptor subunit [Empedobacter sp. GD03797]MDH1882604.1 efflux RND transporter periplasmic adaptor subunit [Empedobacter sp. GD03797]
MKRVALFVALSTVLLATSCSSKKQEKEEVKDYPITTPIKMDTIVDKDYVAQIQSVRNIEIRAQEKGYLQKVFVDEGQHVQAGQLLFRIMPSMYQAEYLKSKAEVKEAQIELQNSATLADNNVVSKNEKAIAQARLEKSKAEMQLAQLHLSFTDIRAPFSGVIDRIPMKLGSLIDEGMLLTNLSDNSSMFAYFNVSEPEYLDYQTNIQDRASKQVSLIMANNKPLPEKGLVETIEGEFNNETGNIAFRARFANPNHLLRNGETGKVKMTVPLHDALLIPQKATYEIQDKTYVFVVDKNGVVKSRNITIGLEMPDVYVVESGLSEKDNILLEGVQKVKDDDKIKTKFIAPRKVLSSLKLKSN